MLKRFKNLFYILLVGSTLFYCSENSSTDSEEQGNVETALNKSLDSLTESEISAVLAINNATQSGIVDEDINEAIGDVIEIMKGSCGGVNCGMGVKFQNKSKRPFRLTVKCEYKTSNEIVKSVLKEYVLSPSEVVEVGCTHICLNGEKVEVSREIVSSNYLLPM